MDEIEKIIKLDKKIIKQIRRHTDLSTDQIEKKSMREIEEHHDIKAKPPKIYFKWEAGEKTGWQTHPYKFVSQKEYDRREKKLEKLLKV